ncbi:gluconeogenesis factor YvcK family protein [Caminicella sporogenes]|uniref:gluconeogenesis factor YvcK family protein n=1 Tax=Caminicella sporogenes TaxID=166485 RepID=UPI0025412F6B|nr:YvcK family protein [Caminicella sporogenes]WIF95242.1 YvcK family protein [Caminicella sporogenes]
MNIFFKFKLDTKLKKSLMLGIIGVIFTIFGLSLLMNVIIKIESKVGLIIGFIALGIGFIFLSVKNLFNHAKQGRNLSDLGLVNKIYDKNILSRGIKVVVIGGGTGLSVLLRGIKKFTSNITAIVTVADDGGGSGKLREDLGMLPPGDIRNCILALADTEPIMEKLLQYRFKEGTLKNQSFGNLLIAAMVGISDSFEHAIKRINQILAVAGKVLPVTTEDITLYAKLKNGQIIKGESQIPLKALENNSSIEKVFIKPKNVKPLEESIKAIKDADVIILGPGSLYTSIIPNLLVNDITKFIRKSSALKIYVSNLMTQPGETDNFTVGEHVKAILNHAGKNVIQYVYANNESIPNEIIEKYREEGAEPVELAQKDMEFFSKNKINVIENNYIEIKKGYLRHNAFQLSKDIVNLVIEKKYSHDKIRFLELNSIVKKVKNTANSL